MPRYLPIRNREMIMPSGALSRVVSVDLNEDQARFYCVLEISEGIDRRAGFVF